MKFKKLFTKKELQKFGELCRDTREKEILEMIDEKINENINVKPATELYLNSKKIKEWRLINNGILEYGNVIAEWRSNILLLGLKQKIKGEEK